MIAHAHLAAQDCAVAHRTGTRDAGLRGNDDIAPDAAVVTDVNQVVELGPAADPGFFQGPAVNGGVGSDLHVVLNDQRALLGKLGVLPGRSIADVAEAIGPQHRPGVDHHPIAQGDAGVDDHPGVDAAIAADADAGADHRSAADDGGCADAGSLVDRRRGRQSRLCRQSAPQAQAQR